MRNCLFLSSAFFLLMVFAPFSTTSRDAEKDVKSETDKTNKANGAFGSRITEQQLQQVLALHNKARADVGVGPLNWSNELASYAQQWAEHLASSGCKLEHRPASGEWRQCYGENLFMGTAGYYDVEHAVQAWEAEKKYFKGKLTPSNWQKVGHYTQMVWRETTHVGCGLVECDGNLIVVCNYNPPGNMMGQTPY